MAGSFKSTVSFRLASLALILCMAMPALAASKKYQVTGKVVEVSSKVIIIQKGDEKWEIERNADTKIDGELKVGAKVTVHYHMTADTVDPAK